MAEQLRESPWPEESTGKSKGVTSRVQKPRTNARIPLLPLIIGGLALVVIGGGLIVLMGLMTEPPQGADLEVIAPQEILVGQPFSLKVQVVNNNTGVIRNGKISIFLPPEISFSGKNIDERVYEEVLGDIDQAGIVNREIDLIAVSGVQSASRIETKLSYFPPGANANFEKTKMTDLVIGAPAVTLDIATPQKALSGGSFETKITINNQSTKDVQEISLSLNFPESYQLHESSASSTGGTTWMIGTLKRGEVKVITFLGSLSGQENDFSNITARLFRKEGMEDYLIGEKIATLSIAAPSLAVSIRPNTRNGFVSLGEQVQYSVTIKNNAPIALENLTVKATLLGDLFNMNSLTTNALVNGVNNTLSWNTVTSPSLRRLGPGESQILSFSVGVKSRFPIQKQSDKNFVLKVNGSAESPTILPGISSGKTVTLTRTETKVAGTLSLQAKVYYKDPTTGQPAVGPYPPKVNQPTQYTVHWILRNYASDMSRIEISSFLDPYARVVGTPTSNVSSTPLYNPASGQISWKIDRITATQGVLTPPIEAIFRIEATPPSAYATHDLTLLRSTTMKAVDEFVQDTFSLTLLPVLSNLPDDPSPGNVDRTVRP